MTVVRRDAPCLRPVVLGLFYLQVISSYREGCLSLWIFQACISALEYSMFKEQVVSYQHAASYIATGAAQVTLPSALPSPRLRFSVSQSSVPTAKGSEGKQ
jgi:hypothetical protein